jgi:hypothetical protein
MKGYPVTRDELISLGGVGLATSVLSGVGANFISRSFDLDASIELSGSDIKPGVIAKWQTRETDFFVFGIILLALAALATVGGGLKIWSIIKSTEHPTYE